MRLPPAYPGGVALSGLGEIVPAASSHAGATFYNKTLKSGLWKRTANGASGGLSNPDSKA